MAVSYTPELLSRAQAWLSLPLTGKRYEAGMAELTSLYAAITGQQVSSCRQCQYSDYAAIVVAYLREATTFLHPETVSSSKYTIAPGLENEQFVHPDYTTVVTADNLTDEAAEFFIKNGYRHAFLKNGQPIVAATADTEGTSEDSAAPTTEVEQEQQAHATTTAALEAEKQAHATTTTTLEQEKKAHAANAKELEAEKKNTTKLTEKNEKLAKEVTELKAKLAAKTAPAPAAPAPDAPAADPAAAE